MAAFITRLFMVAVFVGAMLPTAMASPKGKAPPAPKCKKGEFYFKEAKLCLKYGGPSDHAKPPKGKACPAYGWAWSRKYSACVPKFPPTHVPQCPKHYEWCPPEWACVPVPTKPGKTPPSKPSGKSKPKPKTPTKPKGKGKRQEEIALPKMCPAGFDACPIPTADGLSDEFECVDTANELESCGGCASIGDGQDCTAIPGVWNVACVRGQCQVSSCAPGFTLSKADGRCVAN